MLTLGLNKNESNGAVHTTNLQLTAFSPWVSVTEAQLKEVSPSPSLIIIGFGELNPTNEIITKPTP